MQVAFQLHPSFDNPMREYTHPPYELTETGWGEFEIAVLVCPPVSNGTVGCLRSSVDLPDLLLLQLHFTDDAGEEPVELYHKLKLYGEDDPSGQASTKKPVSVLHKVITLTLMLVKPCPVGARHVFCTRCLHRL